MLVSYLNSEVYHAENINVMMNHECQKKTNPAKRFICAAQIKDVLETAIKAMFKRNPAF